MKPTSHASVGHGHGESQNPDVEHEHSDVNVRAILSFAGIITTVTVVCAVIVWAMLGMFERMATARDPKLSPLAMPAAPMPQPTRESPYFGSAPEPRLLTNEPAVLSALRQSEYRQMHEYGWKDEKAGVARVPIDQAKKLIAERGVPARAGGVDALLGTHLPAFGDSTGGQAITTGRVAIGRSSAPTKPAQGHPPDPTDNPVSAPTSGHRGGGQRP